MKSVYLYHTQQTCDYDIHNLFLGAFNPRTFNRNLCFCTLCPLRLHYGFIPVSTVGIRPQLNWSLPSCQAVSNEDLQPTCASVNHLLLQVVLVAHSYGCYIASHFASRNTHLVSKLFLVSQQVIFNLCSHSQKLSCMLDLSINTINFFQAGSSMFWNVSTLTQVCCYIITNLISFLHSMDDVNFTAQTEHATCSVGILFPKIKPLMICLGLLWYNFCIHRLAWSSYN